MSAANPTLQQTLNGWREAAAVFWQARTGQERRFLAVGGAVLALALGYVLLVAPAVEGRARLRLALPELRQQAAELQALALQAASLQGRNAVPPPPMTREALSASLTARSLAAQSIAVTGDYAKLQLNGVSFPGLMDWLAAQRRDGRIQVQEASVGALATAGMVDATLTLRQNAGGAR